MTWTIGPAGVDDIEAVLGLWSAAEAPQSVPDTPAAVRALMARDHDALLVARTEDRVIGSLIAAWDGWRGTMYRLAVDPDHRRDGVATALIRAGEERLLTLGARRVGAIVVRTNAAAVAAWMAAGYDEIDDQSRFARNL